MITNSFSLKSSFIHSTPPLGEYFSINEYINKRNSFLESILYKNGKNNKTEKEQKEFLRKILNAEYMDKKNKT